MTTERILVVAPTGRDAHVIADIARPLCAAELLASVSDVGRALPGGADGLVLTEEALDAGAVKRLLVELRRQPPWSDLPVLVLVSAGVEARRATDVVSALAERTNVTFLERPVRASTLTSALSSMLRSRRRQYQVRDLIEAYATAEGKEREARAQAERAMAMRDEFLGIASHELRTPLTVVMGHSELLLRRARRGEVTAESLVPYIEELHTHARRLDNLIEDLLDTSRIEQGRLLIEPARVDLVRLVETVVRRFLQGDEYDSKHRIKIEGPDGPIVGFWDESRLDQVVTNLVSNALKYSPRGGLIQLRMRADKDAAYLDVLDEGLGIPRDRIAELFQPFARLHQEQIAVGGTGLGLYITQKLVERHLGDISASNNPAQGATFSVRLPLRALIEVEEELPAPGSTHSA